jgi:hypothetical protein
MPSEVGFRRVGRFCKEGRQVTGAWRGLKKESVQRLEAGGGFGL